MAKTKDQPVASFTVRYYDGRIEVSMQNFEKLNPAKIQSSYPIIHEEWGKLQQAAVLEQRKRDRERELAEQEETENA